MTDGQMCCDLKIILSRLLMQIIKHEKRTNQLLPTPTLLLLHMEIISLSALQDYPCTSKTSTQAAIPWYALKSVYGAARGWRQGDFKVEAENVIVIIKCTIREALEDHYSRPADPLRDNTVRITSRA